MNTEITTEISREPLKKLREKFEPHQISLLPKPTKKDNPKGKCNECGGYHGLPAIHLDYVGHAALTDRLLDTDDTWTWEPLAVDADGLPKLDRDGGLWIRLTVCGVTRLGYGDAGDKTGANAMKERIGDALRNAAMRFGAALDLWHKGELHADAEPEKKTSKNRGKAFSKDIAGFAAQDVSPQSHPNDVISEAQLKRFFALSKQGGWSIEEIKAKIASYGFAGGKDITKDKYEELCTWVQSEPEPNYPDHRDPSELTETEEDVRAAQAHLEQQRQNHPPASKPPMVAAGTIAKQIPLGGAR